MNERLLRLLLPEAMIGDLRESGRPVWKEVAVAFAPALVLGVLGGGALITVSLLTHFGRYILFTYGAIFIAMTFLRRGRLLLFMTATLILYVWVAFDAHTSVTLLGHAWRLGLMLGIGIILSSLPPRRAKLRIG